MLGGLVLYWLTCAPGVLWQDSAMFQSRVWRGDVAGIEGLPLAHPLYILLAKLFAYLPTGEFAYRVNLFSALCGFVSLGLAADLLLRLTGKPLAAICGTILLGVSHTFWTHAVIAEVYDLYAVGLLAELCLLERFFRRRQLRWLVFAAIANGLNLSNHLMAILHWPAYAGVLIWALRGRVLLWAGLPLVFVGLIGGSLPYLYLIFGELAAGRPMLEVVKESLVGPPNRAGFVLTYSFPVVKQIKHAALYFAMNFPTPLALLAPAGLFLAIREGSLRWFAAFGGLTFATGFVFAFRYVVLDQFVFYMPCYVLFAMFAGVGLGRVRWAAARSPYLMILMAALPAGVYEVAPQMMRSTGYKLGTRDLPYRDTYAYFIRPRKNGEDGAEKYAREALSIAGPDGALVGDVTVKNPVTYVRDMLGVAPGVAIEVPGDIPPNPPTVESSLDGLRAHVRRGRAFSCSVGIYVPQWMRDNYEFEPKGIIYLLREKIAAPVGEP